MGKKTFIALVAVQGEFKDAKGNELDYSAATGGALIYPSIHVEGTESATRHLAKLATERRIEGKDAPEAAIIVFAKPIPRSTHHGADEIVAFLTGKDYTVVGKLPSAIAAASTKAKRRTRAAAASTRKRTIEVVVPVEVEATV